MAEIETSVDHDYDLTVSTVSGSLTAREILDKPTTLILWDFTNTTWPGIESDELRRTVKGAKKYSRKGGRTALVFSQEVDFGIGRMLVVFAEMEGYNYKFRSFRSAKMPINGSV